MESVVKLIEEIHKSNPNCEVICASKGHSLAELTEIKAKAGIEVFGENRVQELLDKYDSSLTWDFIGQLQTNKAKYIIDKVRLIHSVDRENLAVEIDKEARKRGKVQRVLIEVNSGDEANKGGISVGNVTDFYKTLQKYPSIEVVGIMAVAPLNVGREELKRLFTAVKNAYDGLRELCSKITVLSMGMSGDYETALECGSNLLRLGRIMFRN